MQPVRHALPPVFRQGAQIRRFLAGAGIFFGSDAVRKTPVDLDAVAALRRICATAGPAPRISRAIHCQVSIPLTFKHSFVIIIPNNTVSKSSEIN